jgi:hypothetical protein
MYFYFFLKHQQLSVTRDLKKLAEIYGDRRPAVKVGLRASLEVQQQAYSYYALVTKNWRGLFRSFIVGTREHRARLECAQAIAESHQKINTLLKLRR